MACQHRFFGKHKANSLLPDWEVDYLFIGTFNPDWDFPKGQNAKYFYGRTQNNYFWDLLPEIWGHTKLRDADATAWQDFLKKEHIGITDIIRSIEDADRNNPEHEEWMRKKRDNDLTKFQHIIWNTDEIIELIQTRRQSLKGIYITNRTAPKKINEQFDIVRIEAEKFDIPYRRLTTPSKNARFHWKGIKNWQPLLLSEWKGILESPKCRGI